MTSHIVICTRKKKKKKKKIYFKSLTRICIRIIKRNGLDSVDDNNGIRLFVCIDFHYRLELSSNTGNCKDEIGRLDGNGFWVDRRLRLKRKERNGMKK